MKQKGVLQLGIVSEGARGKGRAGGYAIEISGIRLWLKGRGGEACSAVDGSGWRVY